MQEEISDIIRTRLKDPRIGFTSVSRVDTTDDLRSCKIYVSVLNEEEAPETLKALESATGIIRSELLHRLHARRVPELKFFLDRNIAYSVHISSVLDQIRKEEAREDEDEEESP